MAAANSTTRTCLHCEKPFPIRNNNYGQKLCSTQCQYAYLTRPLEERFWGFVSKTDRCWLWTGARDRKGYGNIGSGRQKPRTVAAHRVSWEIHNGEIPDGLHVLHRCDTPACVNPEHLFLGTHADNMRDCGRKGRFSRTHVKRGEKHGNAKLTEAIIRSLLADYASGMRQIDIAAKHQLSRSVVWRIVHRKAWAHVEAPA